MMFLKEVSDAGHFATGLFEHIVLFCRLWVILQLLWKAVKWHLLHSGLAAHHTGLLVQMMTWSKITYGWQYVSNMVNIFEKLLDIFFLYWQNVSNTSKVLCKATIQVSSHLFQWPTGSEWCGTFYFVKDSLITSFPMTRMSVTLHMLWRQSHHIYSYVQQEVSDIAHVVKHSLITSFPMTNREWVTLDIC